MPEISEAISSPSPAVSWMPGLRALQAYRRAWLASDVIAGVAAVALPIGIAYARLAGFPPVV